jgi:2-methylcitrate dehydratase PrpD
MNLSYCLAAALVDGHFSVDQVSEEAIASADIVELTKRIEIVEDPELDKLGGRYRYAAGLEIYLRDGNCLKEKVLRAKGSEEWPLNEGEIETKFRLLSSKVLGPRQIDALLGVIYRLEHADEVKSLGRLTVPPQ